MTMISRVLLAILLAGPAYASLSVETGQFAANTGSATTTVSHSFGSAPKAIILFTTGQTANGSDTANNASWSFGFSDGTNHRCIAWGSSDNSASTVAGLSFRDTYILEYRSAGKTVTNLINAVSFSSTNFVVTWELTPASAYLVGYMLLGGSDISNVAVGTHTMATTTGSKSQTGLAFQPDFGIFINAGTTVSGTDARALGSIGFVKDSTHEFTMALGIDDAQNMTANIDAVSYTNQAAFMSGITAGAETVDMLADFTSWNSDGFTYNLSNAPGAAWLVGYLLIKGGQWDVGTSTTPTSSGTRSVTGMAFQPTGLFLSHASATADNTVTIDANTTVGVATSTSTEATASASQDDAVLNTTVNRTTSNTKILNSGSFPATSVDFTSFNSDGFTVTDASGGATAYQMGWFAMADNAAAPTSSGAGWWGSGQYGF